MSFNLGNLIKLNSELFPDGTKDDELYGDLGYPGLFRYFIFEVQKVETDPNRGEIAHCKITNPDVLLEHIQGLKNVKYEGSLVLQTKDMVMANTKYTIKYSIGPVKSKEEMIADLFADRKKMQAKGKLKTDPTMRANWKQIQILRGEVKGDIAVENEAVVTLTNLKSKNNKVKIPVKDLPKDEESQKKFEQMLASKIRKIRQQDRIKTYETKDVFGQKVEKLAGVYLKEKSLLTAYEDYMRTTLETDKKPIDKNSIYVGVEIEFIYTGAYEKLKKMLIDQKLHRYVTLKTDGSLRACHNAGGYQTLEMTVLCRRQDLEGVMTRLDQVLANPEIDGYANRSCGLHVHLDMRSRNPALVYKNLVRIQNILRGSQPAGRVKNTHCRVNTIEDYQFNGERIDERQPRYSVVNGQAYSKHKSIEIRIHEGTTNCEDIYNWVQFLDAVASHTAEIPKNELRYAEDLVARFDVEIPLEAISYVDQRIKRFNSLAV